jgi:eukaryotic-like serine/threonine-protein kinase
MTPKQTPVYATAFNKYTVISHIGNGGSGTVIEVLDAEGKHFALKIVDPAKTSAQKLKRFQNEIAFCQRNTHPNIVTVLDHGRSPDDEPFYVMPLYGMTLEKAIQQSIPPNDVLRIFGQLLNGVEAAHRKRVTHRDLKPQNVLCDARQTGFVIADFGIASFEEEELHTAVETRDNERLANFQYAAPEQRSRGREVTFKADIYALGLILNEMFTKEIPQGTGFKTIASLQSNFSYLDGLVDQMVRQDPAERPDIAEIKKLLIARHNEFISLQKIDQLTREVVPEDEIDDPLIREPIKIESVDYRNGMLIVSLSQAPDGKWINEFHNQGNYQSFASHGPVTTTFSAKTARVGAPENHEQQQIDYLKSWINNANGLYKQRVEREAENSKLHQRRERDQLLAEERRREGVLKKISW